MIERHYFKMNKMSCFALIFKFQPLQINISEYVTIFFLPNTVTSTVFQHCCVRTSSLMTCLIQNWDQNMYDQIKSLDPSPEEGCKLRIGI
jgi:hypothetical protein